MKVCTLASSSKGNSTLIYSNNTAILIDCGISLSELTLKLELIGVDISRINAILITHEHSDHIKGLPLLIKKYNIPCFCYEKCLPILFQKLKTVKYENLIRFNDIPFQIGDFKIQAFEVPHDSVACVGFNIFDSKNKVSIATDLGNFNDEILSYLFNSKLVILEANHDIEKLKANPHYSYALKNRILSDHGHLNNIDCAKIISRLAENNVKQVVLAHLSEENNTPDLCFNCICDYLNSMGVVVGVNINIDIASPSKVGPIFSLT